MEEYKWGGSKGSGAKSSYNFRLNVETPTTTTTTTLSTTYSSLFEDTTEYLDDTERTTVSNDEIILTDQDVHEDEVPSEEEVEDSHYPDHQEEEYHYPDHQEEEYLYPDHQEEDGSAEHEISEHSDVMTEHTDYEEKYAKPSRLHVDEAEARDANVIEEVCCIVL